MTAFADIVAYLAKLGPLQGWRRVIGITALVLSGAISVATGLELTAAVPMLAHLQPWLQSAGTYIAIVGAAFKDDGK